MTELTLEHLSKVHDAFKLLFPPGPFDKGADMCQETWDALKASGKFVPMGSALSVLPTDILRPFGGIDIHVIPGIPFGTIEPCKCKERHGHG